MGERKGQNKYYPPDYDPKKGGLNKWQGTHALRERARKLHLGILIIRFEMPFNVWCDGCGNHVGMGVRYNAEKKKVGMYYTTPIYEFRMKCHLCTNHFLIRTDPQHFDYELVEGLRRQERRWDMSTNEQIASTERETSKKLATDAMFKLEHGELDVAKSKAAAPELERLEAFQDRMRDDFARNQELRKSFRTKKKEIKQQMETDKILLEKSSLSIDLLPENSEDVRLASLISQYKTVESSEEKQQKIIKKLDTESVFAKRKRKRGDEEKLHKLKPDTLSDIKRSLLSSKMRQKMDKLDKDLDDKKQLMLVKKRTDQKEEISSNCVDHVIPEKAGEKDVAPVKNCKNGETKPNNSSLSLLSSNYQTSSDSETSNVD